MLLSVSYRVFARKYRPQTFEEVVGQEHITRTLHNAIRENRVAQAYMFVGPRGIGKTSTARILAKALNCAEGPTPHPCGKCASCLEIAEGRCLDVIEIDGASNNGVDNIRDLRDNAAYSPARGPFKIYLIDEVHMLSTGAFNALLKTLEEPPGHVKFIFATTEAQKVPATITSRCQRFDLRRIPSASIAKHLAGIATKENITLDEKASEAISRASEGGLRDAESMLDQAVAFCGNTITHEGVMEIFGFTPREVVSALVGQLMEGDAPGALETIAAQDHAGKDLSRLLDDVTSHLRDLLVQGVTSDAPARRDQFLALLDHFAETETRMRWAPDKKLQFDVAAIKAVHLLTQASLDEVLETLTSLRSGDSPPPTSRPPAKPVARPAAGSREGKPDAPVPEKEPSKSAAAPPPAPRPKPAASSEDFAVAASVAWEKVAAHFASSLVSRWMSLGVFAGVQGNQISIHLPICHQSELSSVVGKRAHRDAEKKLTEELGKSVVVKLEAREEIEAPPMQDTEPSDMEADGQEAPAQETSPTEPPPENSATEITDVFHNDPLIQEAIQRFKAEIQD